MRSRPPFDRIAAATLETLAWVGLATALVALLDSVAEPAGLGSLYLIAVLAVAIRRGQVAALAAAVLGVLTLNFFFIKPLHQLTIADVGLQTEEVVAVEPTTGERVLVEPEHADDPVGHGVERQQRADGDGPYSVRSRPPARCPSPSSQTAQ